MKSFTDHDELYTFDAINKINLNFLIVMKTVMTKDELVPVWVWITYRSFLPWVLVGRAVSLPAIFEPVTDLGQCQTRFLG